MTQLVLRVNPAYDIALLDRLEPSVRAQVSADYDADDLYGALIPRPGSRLPLRAVSIETALLLFTLISPGPVPEYVARRLGPDVDAVIGRLVLDDVLQVEHNATFMAGPAAADVVLTRRPADTAARVPELSLAALRYAQKLVGVPAVELGHRLYRYGRQPVSPQLRRRFGDDSTVERSLGLDGDRVLRALPGGWYETTGELGRERTWRQWVHRPAAHRSGTSRYKLYVSPALDSAAAAISGVVHAAGTTAGVSGFKVGNGLVGICRPDKIVVYAETLDTLHTLAERLSDELADCQPHGVAFTAAVTDDGLVSWGIDPPRLRDTVQPPSWRGWVCEQLASHLTAAMATTGWEPWQYALERLRLDGVDIDTWQRVTQR